MGQVQQRDREFQELAATELLQEGRILVAQGRQASGIEKFRLAVQRFPKSASAGVAQLEIGKLFEANREFTTAFEEYQNVINRFPDDALFQEALAGQARICDTVVRESARFEREGKKLPKKILPPKELRMGMLKLLVANTRHSQYAPKAQFLLGVAWDQEGEPNLAKKAHAEFLEFYPDHMLADDAAFQIGYIDFKLVQEGHSQRHFWAQLAFAEFLLQYPESPKAAPARNCLARLDQREVDALVTAARFHERRGEMNAARIYYADVAKRFPGTVESDEELAIRIRAMMAEAETKPE